MRKSLMQANISYGYMTMWFVGFWSGSVEEMWKNWELQTTETPESASELWWKLGRLECRKECEQ